MAKTSAAPLRILRRPVVEERTGLSRSSIYSKIRKNPKRPEDFDPTFPHPIQLGGRAVGWLEHELDDWIAAQIEKSRGRDTA